MADVLRSCTKTGCRWPAAASLSYRYASRQVWLLDLAPAPDPSLYDLCPHHADHLVVPKGWERVDDRTVQEVMVEPSADDRAEEAARRRRAAGAPAATAESERHRELVGAAVGRGNRYAALVEQLPQLAAETAAAAERQHLAMHPAGGSVARLRPVDDADDEAANHAPAAEDDTTDAIDATSDDTTPPTALADTAMAEPPLTDPAPPPPGPPPGPLADTLPRTGPTTGAGRPSASLPSRELAPLPADAVPAEPTPAEPAPADPPTTDHAPPTTDQAPPDRPDNPGPEVPIPGQLAIPVDDLDGGRDAVIVPFDLAGSRRRGRS